VGRKGKEKKREKPQDPRARNKAMEAQEGGRWRRKKKMPSDIETSKPNEGGSTKLEGKKV